MNLSSKRINYLVLLILSLYPLVGMGIDLIAPSLPAISEDLQVSNSVSQNLITIYLLGYAGGNFLMGFLSDALGRRKLLIIGFLVFTLASLLPVFFPSIAILMFARFLQGLMIAAFAVMARAILSDILEPEKLMRTIPLVATMWGIGPIIGPVIGGYLQHYFNWHACFVFFAILGFIAFISTILMIPETHFNRHPLNFKLLKKNFMTIITHRVFFGVVTLMGLSYSLLIVFNTLGPFLIQEEMGYSAIYFGHIALYMGVMFLLGTLVCRRLIKYYQPEKILLFAVPLFFVIALLGLFLSYIESKNIGIIVFSNLLMFLGAGIIYPACMAKGIALFRHLAGSGTAVMNLINILISSSTAFLTSFIHTSSAIPLAWIYVVLMFLSGASYLIFIRPHNN